MSFAKNTDTTQSQSPAFGLVAGILICVTTVENNVTVGWCVPDASEPREVNVRNE